MRASQPQVFPLAIFTFILGENNFWSKDLCFFLLRKPIIFPTLKGQLGVPLTVYPWYLAGVL